MDPHALEAETPVRSAAPTRDQFAGVPAFHDLADIAQDLVAARILGHAVADPLADDLPLGLGNRLDRRVDDIDRLHRHRLVKAQPTLVDRPIPAFCPLAVADLPGGGLPIRRGLDAKCREQVRLLDLIELQPLLRSAAEQLALEPATRLARRYKDEGRGVPRASGAAASRRLRQETARNQ